jgi:hypothetical protein
VLFMHREHEFKKSCPMYVVISYYKVSNLCVSVSVCVSVCPAIRFHSSQRIFSKCSGNLLRVITRSVGYIFFRACVLNAHVCVNSLIFERIKSKFAGNILRLTICGKD